MKLRIYFVGDVRSLLGFCFLIGLIVVVVIFIVKFYDVLGFVNNDIGVNF